MKLNNIADLKRHIPTALKPPSDSAKKIPFEAVDLSLYKATARCVSFRTVKDRMLMWIWGLIELYEYSSEFKEAQKIESTMKWVKDNSEISLSEETIIADKLIIQLNKRDGVSEHFCTVTYFLTSGTVMIQGNGHKEWAEKHFPALKTLVEEHFPQGVELVDTTVPKETIPFPADVVSEPPQNTLPSQNNVSLSEPTTPASKNNVSMTEQTTPASTMGSPLTSPSDSDITKVKKVMMARANRLRSDKEKDYIERCSAIEGSIVSVCNRLDNLENDLENRMDNKLRQINSVITNISHSNTDMMLLLQKVEDNQKKMFDELKALKKKDKNPPKTVIPDAHEKKIDKMSDAVSQIQAQISVITNCIDQSKRPKQDVSVGTEDTIAGASGGLGSTVETQNKKMPDSLKANRVLTLKVPQAAQTVIISDSIFRDIQGDMIDSSVCVRPFGAANTVDFIDMLHRYTENKEVERVIIHAGSRDSKFINEDETKDKIQYLVQSGVGAFPKAELILSAVLPGKSQKNQANINKYNEIMKQVCDESEVAYADFSHAFRDEDGIILEDRFYDHIHPSEKGNETLVGALASYIYNSIIDRDDQKDGTTQQRNVRKQQKDVGKQQKDIDKQQKDDGKQQKDVSKKQKDVSKQPEESDKDEENGATGGSGKPGSGENPIVVPSDKDREPDHEESDHISESLRRSRVIKIEGNRIVAYAAKVESRKDVRNAVQCLYSEIKTATTNTVLYRYHDGGRIVENWDDDGEKGAGKAVTEMLRAFNVTGVVVIISRWFACHIGPKRFNIFRECAADALEQISGSYGDVNKIAVIQRPQMKGRGAGNNYKRNNYTGQRQTRPNFHSGYKTQKAQAQQRPYGRQQHSSMYQRQESEMKPAEYSNAPFYPSNTSSEMNQSQHDAHITSSNASSQYNFTQAESPGMMHDSTYSNHGVSYSRLSHGTSAGDSNSNLAIHEKQSWSTSDRYSPDVVQHMVPSTTHNYVPQMQGGNMNSSGNYYNAGPWYNTMYGRS